MDETALNELLECSVCLERLDASSKVLPCQHTFCRRCLEEIVCTKKELRCPECRMLVEIGVDDLPANILLVRLLEGMKNANISKGGSSSGSSGPSSPNKTIANVLQGRLNLGKFTSSTLPCARALYNYDAKEPGDLSFKKGDVILLRKQVDENWYHGELSGQHGFFPATYVQVINPLPQESPRCKALYDFVISDKNEKDCLTFQKDEIVTVIRRVDDNWAEGKLGERIGIFPISFVEMNDAAKWLINSQTSQLESQSSTQPHSTVTTTPAQNVTTTLPMNIPAITTVAQSNVTTTSSTPLTSSTSSSTRSSPVHTNGTTPAVTVAVVPQTMVVGQNAVVPVGVTHPLLNPNILAMQRAASHKRHSLTHISASNKNTSPIHTNSNHRHSLEVSSPISLSAPPAAAVLTPAQATVVSSTAQVQLTTSTNVSKAVPQVSQVVPVVMTSPNDTVTSAVSSIGMPKLHTMQAPSIYYALYNYKPQKDDEVELVKSHYYTVTEKCQDGWFKGTCLRTGTIGVFPGNYVQVVKLGGSKPSSQSYANTRMMQLAATRASADHEQMSQLNQLSAIKHQATVSRAHSFPRSSPVNLNTDQKSPLGQTHATAPPHSKNNTTVTQMQNRSLMSTGLNRTRSPPVGHVQPMDTSSQAQASSSKGPETSSGGSEANASRTGASGNVDISSPANSYHSPRASRRTKSKHSHRHMDSHSSPGSSQIQPPVRGASSASTRPLPQLPNSANSAMQHSISTVTPPNVVVGAMEGEMAQLGATGGSKDKETRERERDERAKERQERRERKERERAEKLEKLPIAFMKRLAAKGKKTRSPPQDDSGASNSGNSHHRSGSLPNETEDGAMASLAVSTKSSHKKSGSLDSASRALKIKPLMRERCRCIVPYPPTSDIELELKLGDIVFVHKKRADGWYKGTLQRTGKTGLFPGSFVEII